MSALTDLGNNSGHIIVTKPDGVTVKKAFANSQLGLREAIGHALESGTLIGNRTASGTITVDDLTGMAAESVTAINLNGNNQIGAAVVVGAHTLATYAVALSDAINAFTPGVGPNYSAEVNGATVIVKDEPSNGSTNNGSAISLAKTNAGILTTETPIDNGSEANTPYDSVIGFRYILNSTPGSAPDAIGGGIEVSKNIIMRGMQSTFDTQTITVAASATTLSFERTMVMMNILLSAGAPETIDTIDTSDFSIGDQILISNASGGSAVTFDETGNIVLANSSDFVSGDPELVLALKLTDVSGTTKWTEIFRAPNIVISVAAMRAVGIGQQANGSTTITMLAGGQAVAAPTAGTDPGYIRVTGSPALTGAFTMSTPLGGAIGADKFIVDYKATPTFPGGGSVNIYGKILSQNEIIGGATRIEARYEVNSATWVITKLQDTDGAQWITVDDIADGAVTTDQLGALAVTTPKIALEAVDNAQLKDSTSVSPDKSTTTMKRRMVSYTCSFESGELGLNQTIFMGGQGTLVDVTFSPLTLIEATDDGAVSLFNSTLAQNMGSLTVTGGSARGVGITGFAPNTPVFNDGDTVTITTSKITAGGTGIVTIIYDAAE